MRVSDETHCQKSAGCKNTGHERVLWQQEPEREENAAEHTWW